MTNAGDDHALLARLDERTKNILDRLEEVKSDVADAKSETLKARAETASVKGEMAGLNARELERNGSITKLLEARDDHEDRLRQLQSQVNDQGLDRDNELNEMSTSVGMLLSWKKKADEAAQEARVEGAHSNGLREGKKQVLMTQRRAVEWLVGVAVSSGLITAAIIYLLSQGKDFFR